MRESQVVVLGIGNILYRDEGFGIRVIERLQDLCEFPENVSVVDGGVLGVGLLGLVSDADHLIVVDAIRNQGPPGSLYRLEEKQISSRIRAKNSLHQVDFLEAFSLCRILGKAPATVLLGAEPEDMETLGLELTPTLLTMVDPVAMKVLEEIRLAGTSYRLQRPAQLSIGSL